MYEFSKFIGLLEYLLPKNQHFTILHTIKSYVQAFEFRLLKPKFHFLYAVFDALSNGADANCLACSIRQLYSKNISIIVVNLNFPPKFSSSGPDFNSNKAM